MKLTDESRTEIFSPTPRHRAVMVQLYYPAKEVEGLPISPYMPLATGQFEDDTFQLPKDTLAALKTYAYIGPNITHPNPQVVIFSPALGTSRCIYNTLLSDLASRGYLIVAIDHPYDADIVEFPDGELIMGTVADEDPTPGKIELLVDVRAHDVSFVLDQIGTSQFIRHIPGGLSNLDADRVVMFGHSLGGATAAAVMMNDKRVIGGFDMDGSIFGPVAEHGLDRPFLLMSRADKNSSTDITWGKFWPHLRSWRLQLNLAESEHYTYSDLPILVHVLNITNPLLKGMIGTINGARALEVQHVYVSAFLDYVFNGNLDPVLQGQHDEYPEVTYPDLHKSSTLEWNKWDNLEHPLHA